MVTNNSNTMQIEVIDQIAEDAEENMSIEIEDPELEQVNIGYRGSYHSSYHSSYRGSYRGGYRGNHHTSYKTFDPFNPFICR